MNDLIDNPNEKIKASRPGRLVNDVQLVLHTLDAQKVLSGKGVEGGISLLQFASQMTKVWRAAEKDDPYGDWYLLKVYDGLVKLQHQLMAAVQTYQSQLNQAMSSSGLIIKPFASEMPYVKPLRFRTPYGYLGAQLVAGFDALMQMVITAKRIGIIFDTSYEKIQLLFVEPILALFKLPYRWQSYSITRDDYHQLTDKAREAQKKLGQIPQVVLTKKLRAPFAPDIPVFNDKKETVIEEEKPTDVSVS